MHRSIICLTALTTLLQIGCVSRTTTLGPSKAEGAEDFGLDSRSRVVEKKLIWIWQKEFRNTK